MLSLMQTAYDEAASQLSNLKEIPVFSQRSDTSQSIYQHNVMPNEPTASTITVARGKMRRQNPIHSNSAVWVTRWFTARGEYTLIDPT